MKRRVLLLVTTLTALGGAFYVYYLAVGGGGDGGRSRPKISPVNGGPLTTRSRWDFADANELYIEDRDVQGRLKAVYRARQWDRRSDGTHVLTDPRVTIYHRGGQQTVLRADRAEVYAEQLARGLDVRRARLEGNVCVFFDPYDRPERVALDERREDIVRVFVDHLELDRERLTILTDSAVTVFSPQADIYGAGLLLSWNESPRELRMLRVEHGQYMAVYQVPEALDMLTVPGGRTPGGAPDANAAASRPASGGPRSVAAASAPAASRPATRGGEAPAANRYRAEFHDSVKVARGSRRLYGADVLALRFDWDSSQRGQEGSPFRRRRPPTTRPAGAPATRPATGPTSRPAEQEPLEIFWTGPLVIRPEGHTDTPQRNRYDVEAAGEKLVLSEPRASATCSRLFFHHPQRAGRLVGEPGRPARLVLAEGAEVSCPTIRFEPAVGRAYLQGAGYMVRRFHGDLPQAKAVALIENEEPNRPPEGERIAWADHVDLTFTQERAAPGKPLRQFINTADFHGGVELRRPAEDDDVRCRLLRVRMARGKWQSAYPAEAVAAGGVAARQEGSDLSAQKVTVRFREVPPAERKAGGEARSAVEPAAVVAEGNVRLRDRRDPNAEPLEALCDAVTSDLIARTAVLTGAPAVVRQGPNSMAGGTIRLDQLGQAAAVDGNGTLHFLTKKDLDGRELAQPRPIAIAWADRMSYQGLRNAATFDGKVVLDSGLNHMACRQMQVFFAAGEPAARPAASRPATAPATRPAAAVAAAPRRRQRLGVDIERYSRRRISMIVADDDVLMQSRAVDERERILRRLQLTGGKLIYDAATNRVTMPGPGNFLAEDYQAPRRRRGDANDEASAAVDRPSQTGFQWEKSMQLSQDDRMVRLEGNTNMVHRSGAQIVLADELPVPRDTWGRLPAGRKTLLRCETMIAKFGPPEQPATRPATRPGGPAATRPTSRPAGDLLEAGPRLGPLELFSAGGDVNLKDGPRQVLGQRIVYNRDKDHPDKELVIVWGFREDRPPANAVLVHEDPATGRSQTWSSPKIIWYRRDNRIVTEQVTGAGGR